MGRIQEMMFPLMIILFAVNSMFLFMVYLPTSQTQAFDGNVRNTFGLNSSQINSLTSNVSGVVNDSNSLLASNLGVGTATVTERTSPAPLTDVIFGFLAGAGGCVLGFLAGGAVGCVAGAASLGLLGFFWKYFSFLAFGFYTWIDLFINPAWGTGFIFLNLAIKGVFFLIMLVGLASFILPFFSSWRK